MFRSTLLGKDAILSTRGGYIKAKGERLEMKGERVYKAKGERRKVKGFFVLFFLSIFIFQLSTAQTMIYLERAGNLSFDHDRIADAQILKDNVVFRHDDAKMYCDSAYFYENTNSLDAFGHVRLVQGDTLSSYSDKLYYDGNTRLARLRRNVRLVHGRDGENPTILTTDSLNYDRQANLHTADG